MGGFERVSDIGSYHSYTAIFKTTVVNCGEKNGICAVSHYYAAAVFLTSVVSPSRFSPC
jgi:hypothetical protein